MTIAPTSFIPDENFKDVIRFAPLVSIDLIIRDERDKILVGLRTNEPARGYYFVPGGVIRKNERLRDAFSRILRAETGCGAPFEDAKLLGVFEHLYASNRFGDPGYGTHYVVAAYEVSLGRRPMITLDQQHETFKWMQEAEIVASDAVHENTKTYFR